MAKVLAERVMESSTSTGAGVFTLAGAVLGFQAFSAVCAVNDTVPYYIEAVDNAGRPTGAWEAGLGTYSAANQLTRTTIRASSNGNAAVVFAAGLKIVGLGVSPLDLVRSGDVAASGITQTTAGVLGAPAPGATVVLTLAQLGALGVSQSAGEVCFFARSVAPTGFLKANGAAVSRTTYAALFAAIGTTFGVGDGVTTFNLPDMRGEFIRGWDDARGIDAGRAIGTAQADQFQSHRHSHASGSGVYLTYFGGAGNVQSGPNSSYDALVITGPTVDGANGTPRIGTETRPRNVSLLGCIRF